MTIPKELAKFKEPLLRVYQDIARRACRPDTEVVFRLPESGLTDPDMLYWRYTYFLHHGGLVEGLLQGEREGYDCVAIACCYDPCLEVAREVLNIPVVAPGESSLLLARLMGRKFGVVTVGGKTGQSILEDNIIRYGLGQGCKGVRSCSSEGLAKMLIAMGGVGDPKPYVEEYLKEARILIGRGAEVLISGCACLGPFMTSQGIVEVDGAPLIDCFIAELKLAEVLVALKESKLPWISRKGAYSQPPERLISASRDLYPGKFIKSL